jgi:lipopolysaccharide export system protein LptC
VSKYDEKGVLDYVLTSKRAQYLDDGTVRFNGQVELFSNGIRHQINAHELLVGIDTDTLQSHQEVIYLGEAGKIIAQGMLAQTKADKLKLTGEVTIFQPQGQKIITRDLFVNHANQQKHYYSNQPTRYFSMNEIIAEGVDMDMQKNVVKLLGEVAILQASGSTVHTKNLTIKQKNGAEIYQTRSKIHYQSAVADIRAQRLLYDVKRQKITLTGGVVGRYE